MKICDLIDIALCPYTAISHIIYVFFKMFFVYNIDLTVKQENVVSRQILYSHTNRINFPYSLPPQVVPTVYTIVDWLYLNKRGFLYFDLHQYEKADMFSDQSPQYFPKSIFNMYVV